MITRERVFNLRKGDKFIMLGTTYRITSNNGIRIHYLAKNTRGKKSRYDNDMGAKSQQIVLKID